MLLMQCVMRASLRVFVSTRMLSIISPSAISAIMLQRQAHAAVRDGTLSQSTKRLSKLGAHGTRPSNIERDLFRLLECTHPLPSLSEYVFDAPRRTSELGVEIYEHAVLLPHEVFAFIAQHKVRQGAESMS